MNRIEFSKLFGYNKLRERVLTLREVYLKFKTSHETVGIVQQPSMKYSSVVISCHKCTVYASATDFIYEQHLLDNYSKVTIVINLNNKIVMVREIILIWQYLHNLQPIF